MPVPPALIHPSFRRLPPPVIVIGMHRSGTSLVAGMLHRVGVFMGPNLRLPGPGEVPANGGMAGYAEAGAFLAVNEALLRGAGAAWNRVEPFFEWERRRARQAPVALALRTRGILRSRYACGMPPGYSGPWGWKDPRTSLTLPLWLQLFPGARVIHVLRERHATARSLHRRALLWARAQPAAAPPAPSRVLRALIEPRSALRWLGRRAGLVPGRPPDPCLQLEGCLDLVDCYVSRCFDVRRGASPVLEVRYEDVVADPASAVRALTAFAGREPSGAALDDAARLVSTRRGLRVPAAV